MEVIMFNKIISDSEIWKDNIGIYEELFPAFSIGKTISGPAYQPNIAAHFNETAKLHGRATRTDKDREIIADFDNGILQKVIINYPHRQEIYNFENGILLVGVEPLPF